MSVDAEPFADRFPSYLTRFVGREQEIAELASLCWIRGGWSPFAGSAGCG